MTRRSELVAGARDVSPMLLGVVPFGLLVGVTGLEAGLSPGVTVGTALVVNLRYLITATE